MVDAVTAPGAAMSPLGLRVAPSGLLYDGDVLRLTNGVLLVGVRPVEPGSTEWIRREVQRITWEVMPEVMQWLGKPSWRRASGAQVLAEIQRAAEETRS